MLPWRGAGHPCVCPGGVGHQHLAQGGEGAEEVAGQLRKIVYDQLQRPEISTLKQSRILFEKEDNPISVDGKNSNLFIMNDDDLLFGKMSCIEM